MYACAQTHPPAEDNNTEPDSQQDVACITPDIVESTELESRAGAHEVVIASILIATPMEDLHVDTGHAGCLAKLDITRWWKISSWVVGRA